MYIMVESFDFLHDYFFGKFLWYNQNKIGKHAFKH